MGTGADAWWRVSCCPEIGRFLRSMRDVDPDAGRPALARAVVDQAVQIAATVDDGRRKYRRCAAADYVVREGVAVWLDVAGAHEAAALLRGLRPIVDGRTAAAGYAAADAVSGAIASWPEARERLETAACEAVAHGLSGDPVKAATEIATALGDAVAAWAALEALEARFVSRWAAYGGEAGYCFWYLAEVGVVAVRLACDEVFRAAEQRFGPGWASPKYSSALRGALRDALLVGLDERRVQYGSGPASRVAVELLERMLGAGQDTEVDGHRARVGGGDDATGARGA